MLFEDDKNHMRKIVINVMESSADASIIPPRKIQKHADKIAEGIIKIYGKTRPSQGYFFFCFRN